MRAAPETLTLNPDELRVESFPTGAPGMEAWRGTVDGYQESEGGSCGGSCRPNGCGADSDHPVFCPVAVPTTDMPTARVDECG